MSKAKIPDNFRSSNLGNDVLGEVFLKFQKWCYEERTYW